MEDRTATVTVTLPEMGESVTEGSIVEWRKKVGDFVAEGDALVDVTTDKVDVEVPATASGVITEILANEGDTVPVGSALAHIDTAHGNGKAANGKAPVGEPAPTMEAPATIVHVTLPEMGESVTEGSIVEIRKRPGDAVEEGDTLLDVTTDKVDVEVPSPARGTVVNVLVAPGDTVAVGATLVEIAAGAAGPAKKAQPAPVKPAAEPAAAAARNENFVADQPARRMARLLEVDLSLVRGSGPSGLILRGDVLAQAAQAKRRPATAGAAPALPLPPLSPNAKLTPLKGPVATLAGYMEQSLGIPTATSFRTLLVDVLDARRKELNGALKAAGRGEKVSFTHVIAYAMVRAA
ncbi:MAG: E3 binding domain-containing protein, partial [Candidatus Eremiobacteraeota bacterium]|nr:E3 binding domain-containing protein [Candidatus Eremiobacteraeota bacterium]